jgi:cytochrome c biogenesis protein CcmG/thiol:disulfide interchange protein DsbE
VAPVPRRLVIVPLLLVTLASCAGGDSLLGVAPKDEPLPRLVGETLDGDRLRASAYADGDALVIYVWATWCAPCRREQPQLIDLSERYEARGVRFLGINYQNDRDSAEAWVSEFDVPYPNLYDPAGETAIDLGYPFLPGTYVVDPDGTIRWVVIGETDAEELSGLIEDVLAA